MSTTPTTPAKKTAAKTETPDQVGKLLAEARTAAVGRTLDQHREDFNKFMQEEAAARNVTWKRRPTEDEKRRTKLKALLEEDPTLLETLLAEELSPTLASHEQV